MHCSHTDWGEIPLWSHYLFSCCEFVLIFINSLHEGHIVPEGSHYGPCLCNIPYTLDSHSLSTSVCNSVTHNILCDLIHCEYNSPIIIITNSLFSVNIIHLIVYRAIYTSSLQKEQPTCDTSTMDFSQSKDWLP